MAMVIEDKIGKGELLFNEGRLEEAEKFFSKLSEKYPDSPEIRNNLGAIKFTKGDVIAAKDYFLSAMAIKEDHYDALQNLKDLYKGCGDWEEFPSELTEADTITEFLKEAGRLDSNDAGVKNDLGLIQLKSNKLQLAEASIREAIELDASYSEAFYSLGKVFLAQERYAEAIDNFISAIIADPQDEIARLAALEYQNNEILEKMREKYQNILIPMEEGIGNMVMLTPTLRAIKDLYPASNITIFGREPSIRVIDGWDKVDRVITMTDDRYYDICLFTIWSNNFMADNRSWLLEHCDQTFQSRILQGQHESDSHFHLARCLGYMEDKPGAFCRSGKGDVADIPRDKPLIALSDTTLNNVAWERKRWPYYREISEELINRGYGVVLVGGKDEALRFKARGWPAEVINVMGKYDICETAYLLEQCEIFIGNDSGPAHIAAATGIPTYVFFGSTLISKNLPMGNKVKSISADLPCSPCQYTDRWNKCNNWECMKAIKPEKVLSEIFDMEKKGPRIEAGESHDLRLIGKDYSDCRIVTEDNRKYLLRDGFREPLRIHLVGAGKANFPWGMENEIRRAIELEGIEIVETDYRVEQGDLSERFMRPSHLMLVCKGSGIPPELIGQYPGKTLLWYQDDVFTTTHAPRDLAYNGHAFDRVYSFDGSALEEYRRFGIRDVSYLPLAMSPALHRKMFLPKKYDVSFVGNIHPNRKPFFEKLARKFNFYVTRAFMDEMVAVFNQSRIVLNLGIGPTGIQQRVFECLGCGSLLITNEIPVDDRLFEDRKHLVYFNEQNIESLIAYYLKHEEERERIAYNGYIEAHGSHTFKHRIRQLMEEAITHPQEPASSSLEISTVPAGDNRKSRRRLLIFWHGIGDNIMATPALRAFREAHPDDFIGYMYLRRIHKDEMMKDCPYVDALYTCSDAWDDYPDYETGVKAVIEEGRQIALREGYDEIIPITLREMPLTYHRIERIAHELGVPLNNWSTEIRIPEKDKREADRILSRWGIEKDDFIVAIHRRGANIHKYWEVDETQKVVDYLKQHYNAKVIAFETHTDLNREPAKQVRGVLSTADLEKLSLKVSAELIKRCSLYIGLDSGPMWIATTTDTPLIALFTMTWMHQSAPLNSNSIVVASDQSWQMATDSYKKKHGDRIVHDSSGGTIIKAESVLKAIHKLNLGPIPNIPGNDLKRQPTIPLNSKTAYVPPVGFHDAPAYWSVFLTLGCSANCDFCIQKIVPEDFKNARRLFKELLSGEVWVSFLNGMEHRQGQPLALIGGEPSLHPDFIHILNNLEGYTITVTTNLISKHFEDIDKFHKSLNTKCPVRFNTSFHPEFIDPMEYINRVNSLKAKDIWVDQVAMVDNPGGNFEEYKKIFQRHGMALRPQSFLGFHKGKLYPDKHDLSVTNDPREHGITDYTLYGEGFSAKNRKPMMCNSKRFLMAPNGDVYNCHYHLYSGRGSVGNLVKGDIFLRDDAYFCPDFGYCNPCDFPHVRFKSVTQEIKPKNSIVMTPKDVFFKPNKPVDQTCPICGQELKGPKVKDMMHCPFCGIYKKQQVLLPDVLTEKLKMVTTGALLSPEKCEIRMKEAEEQVNWAFQHLSRTGKLYDVGASGGFMMKVARDLGWVVCGNEISIPSIQWAKMRFGINLEYGLLEQLDTENAVYDLIIFWHSLEHSQNLEATMGCVQRMIKPKGYLAVAVPIKGNDRELELRYEALHNYEFSERSLVKLMKRYNFNIVDRRVMEDGPNGRQIQAVFTN
ncbi:glycosyltransferase [Deltaproteobacteria bacterium]|nr:glycosyltransferase [Deltaproteobacteria bacterium]